MTEPEAQPEPAPMPEVTLLCRVSGRVQGVWFRGWTQEQAVALGLAGWVRNEADGSVAALISGPEDAVERMLGALHDGPLAARVDRVESAPAPRPAGLRGFSVLR